MLSQKGMRRWGEAAVAEGAGLAMRKAESVSVSLSSCR